jgi:hypothetical protein
LRSREIKMRKRRRRSRRNKRGKRMKGRKKCRMRLRNSRKAESGEGMA